MKAANHQSTRRKSDVSICQRPGKESGAGQGSGPEEAGLEAGGAGKMWCWERRNQAEVSKGESSRDTLQSDSGPLQDPGAPNRTLDTRHLTQDSAGMEMFCVDIVPFVDKVLLLSSQSVHRSSFSGLTAFPGTSSAMWERRGMRGVLALSPCGRERRLPPLSTMGAVGFGSCSLPS